MEILELLKTNNCNLIDVREPFEFESGSVEGAINIPMSVFVSKLDEIKKMEGPIILFCRSGARSHQAQLFLEQQGYKDIHNGGGLMTMYNLLQTAH
jgi:rhodanese-related sulfurtransferase